MKLFITNKEDFDKDFPSSQGTIHKIAYNYLLQSIAYDDSPPDVIELTYDMNEISFHFLNEKNDIYFYEYKTL